jgi:hypothetical protein
MKPGYDVRVLAAAAAAGAAGVGSGHSMQRVPLRR